MQKHVNDVKHPENMACDLCDFSLCPEVVPFCGDFSAVDDFGGRGHGAEVSHPAAPTTSK